MRETASERMGRKNVVFTKDGVRVGVKHVQNEKYVDTTQSWVVKAWNLGQTREDEELYAASLDSPSNIYAPSYTTDMLSTGSRDL